VRKIIDPRSDVIAAGEILLAERTDPGWIMLFSSASGILVERGSLLSHSAIVAREMRIPAIVSIDGIMAWLNDGDEVELDGSNGVVRRIKCANDKTLRSVAETPETIFSMQDQHQMLTAIDS
jgi:pyruvate,water dikinase